MADVTWLVVRTVAAKRGAELKEESQGMGSIIIVADLVPLRAHTQLSSWLHCGQLVSSAQHSSLTVRSTTRYVHSRDVGLVHSTWQQSRLALLGCLSLSIT